MTALVLVTHDDLGQVLADQAEVILGRPPAVTCFAVGRSEDPATAVARLTEILARADRGAGLVVLTDLPGATPHNLACRAAEAAGVPVVSGLNLPMLLKAINHAAQPPEELARRAAAGARQGVIRS